MHKKPKVLIILGPTTSGKTSLSITLAQEFDGEVISADSRQVYRGLDISTGKATVDEMAGIPHHLIDIIDIDKDFSVQQWRDRAVVAIEDILSRGKLPIIAGGTGLYIQALVDNITYPDVPPNPELRTKLDQIPTEDLFAQLQGLDPNRAKTIDQHNRPRLIRAIEIAEALGAVPPVEPQESQYEFLQIGLDWPWETLRERITKRVQDRIDLGMVQEILRLYQDGTPWETFERLGFDQKFIAQHLQNLISHEQMLEQITYGNIHYAKRQMTWFKRDQRIQWLAPKQFETASDLIREFLRK